MSVASQPAKTGSDLWSAKPPVFPKAVKGKARRAKWIVLVVLLAIYWITPWLRWDRGPYAPDQAILVDIADAKAYFFFLEIWPQEIYVVTGILLMMATGLFFLTGMFGRVWCGYACPQTVWTDLYMFVERRIEGDRAQRMRLAKAPWTASKVAKRLAKHVSWIVIAALTGGAWVLYFADAPTVTREIFSGQASAAVYGTIAMLTGTTYLLAGWARETVCTFACPYSRFQSAMFDRDTLMVSYRAWRGEPRGKRKPGETKEGQGDCVDCRQCVEVCPTGIDIRDGVQMECINCGLCVDACDAIMERLGSPTRLIGWDTERNLAACAVGKDAKLRLFRPRTMLYALVYALAGAAVLYVLLTRALLDVTALPDRNPLFVTLSDGSIRNGYTLKLANKTRDMQDVAIALNGIDGASFEIVGADARPVADGFVVTLKAEDVTTLRAFVALPSAAWAGETRDFAFDVKALSGDLNAAAATTFEGPHR